MYNYNLKNSYLFFNLLIKNYKCNKCKLCLNVTINTEIKLEDIELNVAHRGLKLTKLGFFTVGEQSDNGPTYMGSVTSLNLNQNRRFLRRQPLFLNNLTKN